MSSFAGINTALTGLQAHRRTMDVIGQNLANVNTPGYTRQRAELEAIGSSATPTVWATPRPVGGGVTVTAVSRAFDLLASANVDARTADHALLAGRSETLLGLDQITNEPGEDGLARQLNQMWAAWQDASTNVGTTTADDASRQNVLQRTLTVVDTLNSRAADVSRMWETQLTQAQAEVAEVNAGAASIARLNHQIQSSQLTGGAVNELMDQRDQLITRVVELTGATPAQGANGQMSLFLGGNALVEGARSTALTLTVTPTTTAGVTSPTTVATASPEKVRLTLATGQLTAAQGGSLAARAEALGTTLPAALRSYDAVAQAVATQVNSLQTRGVLPGVATPANTPVGKDGTTSTATAPVFGGDVPPGTFTAAGLAVALADPKLLGLGIANSGVSDGSNAKAVAGLGASATGPDAVWNTYVSATASRASAAGSRTTAAQNVLTAAVKDQQSAAGVNLDEETANLIAAQRAYQGAARVLTAVDEMLDVLINKTGLVGR